MFTKSKNHNINYLASIQKITTIRKHSNADRLQCCAIQGNNIITGLTTKLDDLVVYFPLESVISSEFLSYTNSYEDKELNIDKTVKGFFNKKGRVRAISLRSEKSEGYIVPVEQVEKFCKDVLKKNIKIDINSIGEEFDTLFDHHFCWKYVPPMKNIQGPSKKSKGNTKRYESKLVENQFKFHYDTAHLKKEVNKIDPDDLIAISNKIHGANFIVANVLTKKRLSLKDRIAKWLGVNVVDTEYGMIYSSRAVIKNATFNDEKENNHFYDVDIWKIVADDLYPKLKEGITAIGEVYGYTPSGKMIQKNYDYGCAPGKLDYVVFRMTYTSPEGEVFEFNHNQVQKYCNKFGIKMPETYYYGYAKDLFDIPVESHWHEEFLNNMISTYLEKDCHLCKLVPNTPAEGLILRNDSNSDWEVYKLKSFRFLKKESEELDLGEADIETQESIQQDQASNE